MYKNKLIYGIITARGGSKSVPDKNLKKINKRPLIYFSIKTSLSSKLIDRTLISTDSIKIAKLAKKYGCEVPFLRPKKYAGDRSTDYEVFKNLSEQLKKQKELPHYFVHLRPTSPIRNVKIIDLAIKKIIHSNNYDSLRSLSVSKESPYKMWLKNKNFIKPIISFKKFKDSHSIPRQILPLSYWQNGYVDIIKSSTILKKRSISGNKIFPFIIKKETMDIDYLEDLKKVRKNFKRLKFNKRKVKRIPN